MYGNFLGRLGARMPSGPIKPDMGGNMPFAGIQPVGQADWSGGPFGAQQMGMGIKQDPRAMLQRLMAERFSGAARGSPGKPMGSPNFMLRMR